MQIGNRLKFIAPLFLALLPGYSQTTLTCTPRTAAFLVRAEGITERTGDIVLDCSGGVPGSTVTGNLNFFLNVNVTNKLAANNTFTDLFLTVDTGSGPVPVNITPVPNGLDGVVFDGLSFTVPASGNVTLDLTNLRANASQLGPTPQQLITATIGFSTNTGLPLSNNAPVTVGITSPGLLAAYSASGVTCTGSPVPSVLNLANLFAAGTRFFSTRVTEGFAGAFQVKDMFSDTGTRIMVTYSGFPEGAQLFVPDFVAGSDAVMPTAGGDLGVPASGGQYTPGAVGSLLLIRVNGADQTGAGGMMAFARPTSGITSFTSASEVSLTNGAGAVVYEVADTNPSVRESAQFPTFVGLAPGSAGVGTVANSSVSFAPVSTIMVAAPAPIPRFVDVAPGSDCATLGDCNAKYFPHLSVVPPPAGFTAQQGARPPAEFVGVQNTSGGEMNWTASITYQSGTGWLTAYPTEGVNTTNIQLVGYPNQVPPGTYQATLTIDAGPFAGTQNVPITFTVTGPSPTEPVITSVVNAASLQPGPLVAGSLATILGLNLTGHNVLVTFDGTTASLLYTSATQINLQVPLAVAGNPSAEVAVTVDGHASAPQSVGLAVVAPAIFNPGILNQDQTLNGPAHPAPIGSKIRIYATGAASPSSGAITARLAGSDILNPAYAGSATDIPGVQWVDIIIPAGVPSGATNVQVCGSGPTRVCSMPAAVSIK